jgi:hypothetical protein
MNPPDDGRCQHHWLVSKWHDTYSK